MKGTALSNTQLVGSKKNLINVLLALVILTANISIVAQSILDRGTPVGVAPGTPAGSYASSDIENINLFSGNLNFTFPLQKLGGRGGAQSAVLLPIETHWTYLYFFQYPSGGYYNPTPMYNWKPNGAQPGYGPGELRLWAENMAITDCIGAPGVPFRQIKTRLTFTAPGGTEFELRDTIYEGAPLWYGCTGYPLPNRGKTFVTADGTAATFISDIDIQTELTASTALFGYLMMRDGTRYRIDDGLVSWMQDRNGNKITYTYTNRKITLIKDSLGRETTIEYGINDVAPYGLCDRITFKGSGGQTRIIRVSYSLLNNTLATGYSLKPKYQLFPPHDPTFDLPGVDKTTNFDTNVISSVWLPDDGSNTRRYRFFYNSHAELARVELPTGGAYEYDWETFGTCDVDKPEIVRRVIERRVLNEAAIEQRTTYSYATPCSQSGNSDVTVDYFSGSQRISRERHYFYGTPLPRPYWETRLDLYNESAWTQGKEYQTDFFAVDGVTLMRSISQTWRQRAPVNWWSCGSTCTQANAPPNDPRMVETVNTLADTGQVSKVTSIDPADSSGQTVGFDQFNNQTDVWEYDFGSGQSVSFKRRTHTDYMTGLNYTSSSGAHLRGLPSETWVSSDAAGNTKVSRTEFKYDEITLEPRGNVFGWTDPNNSYRGNLTKTRYLVKYGSELEAWLETRAEYDVLGNVVKTIDAKGYVSTVSYEDNFGAPDGEARTNDTTNLPLSGLKTYAFPTSGINALNWITGYSQYDYFTGAPVNTEDVNGVISKMLYSDPLDRPTQTVTAIGTPLERQSTVIYDDLNRRIETKSDLFTLNDNKAKTESFYDGLGRTIESRKYEADGTFVTTKSIPFVMVQDPATSVWRAATKVSNPYRSNETPVWTTSLSDSLGRVIKVIAPDGGISVKTDYSGNMVTVTDQAGKQRRSATNALGQLVRVDEPNDAGQLDVGGTPAQWTGYDYDTLGNMVRVRQGNQYRYFQYDSLGRLRRVSQPEQQANPALNTTGDSYNNQWTAGFTYDNNGNVLTTTDAKNTTITNNNYDALNRPQTRTYSDGITPAVTFTYDDPNVAYSKGKLTKVSNSISTAQTTAFDILGRAKTYQQITDGQTYASSYQYNLSGALEQETYPSGRTVKNEFYADGNLSRISSKKIPTATEKTYADGFAYTAAGAIGKLRLGNNLWEAAKFNSRLQITELGLGISATNLNKWKVGYDYGEIDASGNLIANKNTGNIARQTISFDGLAAPFVQAYKYDSLDRLKEATEKSNTTQTWQQTFGYDRYGNRTAFSQTIGNQSLALNNQNFPQVEANTTTNRFAAGQGYNYDFNGNVITDPSNGGRSFTFNGDNKQTEVRDANNVLVGRYFYDGEGKRVKKLVYDQNGQVRETTVFVYSGGKLVAEYSTVPPPANPTTNYVMTDMLESVRAISDATGQIISRRDFMPFGEELLPDATYRTTAQKYGSTNDKIRQKFTSYERDNEIELDFAQARYYNPKHGRFTAVDPLMASASPVNPQTWNRYIYVGNNPLNITDPTGLSWYYNSSTDSYKWYGDNDTVGKGYTSVAGTTGRDERGVGSFVYQSGGGWVSLNPNGNSFRESATREEATKIFGGMYQCSSCNELFSTAADESVRKGTTVAIVAAVGVGAGLTGGVGLYATGALAGGTTTLGLTTTVTTVGTAAAANPEKTAQVVEAATIQFGKVANQISHTFRHTDALGLNRPSVQSAVENHLRGVASQVVAGKPFNQIIEVGGQRIQYTAYKLSDGTINVGRIHGVK